MEYNFRDIEKKWQRKWVEDKTYKVVEDENKQKFYVLNMFPYPARRTPAGIYCKRHLCPLQAAQRLQRPEPYGV